MDRDVELQKIIDEVTQCYKCPIAKDIQNRVFGEGSLESGIVSLAEAPGKDEDEQGRPFVGKAGRWWEGLLNSVGLRREDVFAMNVLHCRPHNNKLATDKHEIINCRPFLYRKLEIIKPKVIISFGKTAHEGLLGETNLTMSQIRERTWEYTFEDGTKIPVFATYHPSYIMRAPQKYHSAGKAFYDLLKVKEYINKCGFKNN